VTISGAGFLRESSRVSRSRNRRGRGGRGRELAPRGAKKALPQVYLKGGDTILPDIYLTDHGAHKVATGKWIASTMLAGVVGVGAIGTVIYASVDSENKAGGEQSVISELRQLGAKAMTPFKPLMVKQRSKLHTADNKSDRLVVTARGLSTRQIIHDSYARKQDDRDYVAIKPYVRYISTLATARPEGVKKIPPFDPFRLYANTRPLGKRRGGKPVALADGATTSSTELPLSIAAEDENFHLSDREALRLVTIAADDYNGGLADKAMATASEVSAQARADAARRNLHNTTILVRTPSPASQIPDEAEEHSVTVQSGDTFGNLMRNAGAEPWQTQRIITAMNAIYPASKIKIGQKLRYISVPKPGNVVKTEPSEIALYEGHTHLVTVARNGAGDYAASAKPSHRRLYGRKNSYPRRASLYQSLYNAGLTQKLSAAQILKLLRIHAYDTDFKQRTMPGDGFEAFYDTDADFRSREHTPKELLYTSVNINGHKREFYRFRLPSGKVDYYDHNGNSAKKFLMRKPVRGARVRLASGFGYRMHPILHVRKLHTGTDWAGPRGTPILAAGNGTVEFVGVRGGYGNYARIRHANGYKTAYAHMKGFAKGLKKGLKVRQGQVIGYIGTTGRSTGPHLHFEVLVNNKYVNAMTIPVPRGLKLKGHLRAQFIKERDRIDELRSRDPVTTQVASVKPAH